MSLNSLDVALPYYHTYLIKVPDFRSVAMSKRKLEEFDDNPSSIAAHDHRELILFEYIFDYLYIEGNCLV